MGKLEEVKRILRDPENYTKEIELFKHDETWTREYVNVLDINTVAAQICKLFEQPNVTEMDEAGFEREDKD